jgi:hypothetical protein
MERFEELSTEEQRHLAEIVAEAKRRERDKQREHSAVPPCCDDPWYKSN